MTEKIKLSILDQSPVREEGTAHQAIEETTALAKLADKLGYTRFWVSEHHNIPRLAGSAPEVLLAHLAGETKHIRMGSGGIMLPNHSALKVAENFRMLETLFPGRIDLGFGRAPGGDRLTASLLNPSNTFSEADFVQQIEDLEDYLTDKGRVKALPLAETVPDLWVLSSSGQSGLWAAQFGMAFSFAHFINPAGGPQAVAMYKEHFEPSGLLQKPHANMAIFVLCADTEEKADELRMVTEFQLLQLDRGILTGYPPFEKIKDYQYSEEELFRLKYHRQRIVSGNQEQVKEKLTALAARYGVNEIIAVTITHSFKDRLRSYELLAQAFELEARA